MPGFKSFDILDPELDLKRTYFLEASAGTGKTFTIENCVIRLVQEGIPIEQILIVTFTRAATVELKMRIRRNLEEKKLKTALLAFDEAKIFTIHGFCFHTLKEHAIETGFALNQIKESAPQDSLKRVFKDFLRTELLPEEIHPRQLEKVLKKCGNDLETLLKKLSSREDCNLRGRSFQEISDAIRLEADRLGFKSQILFDDLCKLAPNFGELCNVQKQIKPDVICGLRSFVSIFDGNQDDLIDLPILKMVPENLLKRAGGVYPDLMQQLNKKLIPLLDEISNTDLILSRLAERAQAFLSHVCEQEDLVFYDDLLRHMQRCAHQSDFAEKVRQSYQTVLIDEFQDTDSIQWDIFSRLFLGHVPLYLVGDPKQSIYRFRGADLYTYMEAKKQLGAETHATLTRNFRSEPQLVNALNTLFSYAPKLITLPKTQQHLFIHPLEAALPDTGKGKIIFCRAEDESIFNTYIVNEIVKLHQLYHIPYGACAVLVKDRYQAKRFCTHCPLPFATKRNESILESEAFEVLEHLLHAVYNPSERQAVVKVLGGPLYGLSVEKIEQSIPEFVEQFYAYHHTLRTQGILSFFRALKKAVCFPHDSFYLDMLQLVELIAQNTRRFEEYLPFVQTLKQEDPDSDRLKTRLKGATDAIQVMTIHVSKGLEFPITFLSGLMCSVDINDEEEYSEKMRQLYVALTRAKQRVYLPVIPNENTVMHHFLSQVLNGSSLEAFVQSHEHFSLETCNSESFPMPTQEQTKSAITALPLLSFSSEAIYSYSSLMEKREVFTSIPKDEMPGGVETGIVLHGLFESLDFTATLQERNASIADYINKSHLKPWLSVVEQLVENAIHFPLPAHSGSFCLAEVDPKKMRREMEFLYASDHPEGYLKGYIDLFFEYKGYYYIVDWKSNFLESYAQDSLQEAVSQHQYDLQARLYQTAAKKYLKLFNCEERFSAVFIMFIRGIDSANQRGVIKTCSNL